MLLWSLLAIAVAAVILLCWLFRWASADPDIDKDIAKKDFQAEQDWRGLRRSGKL